MIHKNLIFNFDPAVSIVDKIAEEDDIATDVGDDIQPNSTNQELAASSEGWNDIWMDLEEEADDTEGQGLT
jgi:hypothetical protein